MAVRKNLKITRDTVLFSAENTKKNTIVFFSFSVFIHGLLFVGMLFFQDFKLPKPMPPVMQVDLVSFSPDLASLDSPEPVEQNDDKQGVPVKSKTIKKKNKKIKHIKPDISLKKKPKNLKELMAKKKKPKKKVKPKPKPKPEPVKEQETVVEKPEPTPDDQKEKKLEDAREKLAKELEEKNQQQISDALARLKKGVKKQTADKPAGSKGRSGGTGKKQFEAIDLYHLLIGSAIEQNWVFNETLARMDKDLEVRMIVKILKSGEIRDIIYETKSGNRYLDESAKKAVEKANPLPELPRNMRSYDLGLIFTPKGLK